jgi:hypothetical protein
MTRETFHEGERDVQRRAGVEPMAARVGGMIRDVIPPAAQDFLRSQTMLIAGGIGEDDAVWASLLTGAPGFASTIDEKHVHIEVMPRDGDPLRIISGASVGLLAIELATRRRMRVNGIVSSMTGGGFTVETREVFSNCPKYITPRTPRFDGRPVVRAQRDWITSADTFFIATHHPERGADVSHRGGPPGFIEVSEDGSTLTWPDYQGNMLFQTLGNLAIDDRAGLLFVDFDSGATLQLTGRASIEWTGTERAIVFGDEMRRPTSTQ